MKSNPLKLLPFIALLFSLSAYAVPTLQLGAPGGLGEGTYANYVSSSTNPVESDSALTSGGTLFVGGAYGPNDLLIGGQYSGGLSWADLGYGLFNGYHAVLVASMLNTTGASLKVNGLNAFSTSLNNLFPNNHAPLGDANLFMYFDIGDFSKVANVVDFATETGSALGEVKSLSIAANGYSWVHFDVMALATDRQGKTSLATTVDNNPSSHDVTWKNPNNPLLVPSQIPEPATLWLIGLGGIGLLVARRIKGWQSTLH